MGREGLDRAAEILDAERRQRRRIEPVGGPPSHSESSRPPCITTEVLDTLADAKGVGQHAARPHLAEAAMDDAARARLVDIIVLST